MLYLFHSWNSRLFEIVQQPDWHSYKRFENDALTNVFIKSRKKLLNSFTKFCNLDIRCGFFFCSQRKVMENQTHIPGHETQNEN